MLLPMFRGPLTLPDGRAVDGLNRLETLFLYDEVFARRTYLGKEISIEHGDVCVDVGANVGMFSMLAADLAGAQSVLAIEPVPEAFDLLVRNLARHAPGVRTVRCAAGADSGMVRMRYAPYFTSLASLSDSGSTSTHAWIGFWRHCFGESARRGVSPLHMLSRTFYTLAASLPRRTAFVARRPLSEIFREHGIDSVGLLKVDVEGAELDVLAGIADRDWDHIRQIVLELHPWKLRAANSVSVVPALLARRGFRVATREESGAHSLAHYFGFLPEVAENAPAELFRLRTVIGVRS